MSRGAAFALDATVAVIAGTVGFRFMAAVLATVGVTQRWNDGDGGVGYLIVVPVVFVLYCAGFWALIGRTPGMMLLGLRVVTAKGTPPGIGRSIVRALGYFVSAIAMIGFVWIAIDERSQGFHDKLARTFVVYDREGEDPAVVPTT